MYRLVALTLVMLAFLICAPAAASAETTKLWLSILPKDCIFEIVQDGSNEVIYLTPMECGRLIEDDEDIMLPDGTRLNRPPGDNSYVPFIIRANNSIPNAGDNSLAPNEDHAGSGPLPHPHTGDEDRNIDNPATLMWASLMLFPVIILGWLAFVDFKAKKHRDKN